MRRLSLIILVTALIGGVAVTAVSQSERFDDVVAFDVSLITLTGILDGVLAGTEPVPDRFMVLDGTVSAVQVIDRNEETYEIWIELVKGEWQGLEDVRTHKAFVRFVGPRFFSVIPARSPRVVESHMVLPNSRVLVVAWVAEVLQDPASEEAIWLLDGVHVRRVL